MTTDARGRRVYTDAERDEALALYVEHGPREAARRSGIPARNIRRWAEHAGVATEATPEKTRAAVEAATALREARRADKREALRDLLLDTAYDLVERINAPQVVWVGAKDPKRIEYDQALASESKDYSTAAAILLDKFRLEVGESTSRADVGVRREVVSEAGGRALRLVS